MEIGFILQHKLNSSPKISQLSCKIQEGVQKCLGKIQYQQNQEYFRKKKICEGDLAIYKAYLSAYKQQFIDKGQQLCMQNLQSQQTQSLQKLQKTRRQCVQFYLKSFKVMETNVIDKLQNLVYKFDFQQL